MATPILAVMAISRMTCTGIIKMVMKPTKSASRAITAGMSNCLNVRRAASMLSRPSKAASVTALIFCTPWLTPIAKMRNGTSSPSGSKP